MDDKIWNWLLGISFILLFLALTVGLTLMRVL